MTTLNEDAMQSEINALYNEKTALKQRIKDLEVQLAAAPVAAQEPTGALIEAAEHYAAKYEGDDRQDVMTDVLNAFYQGARFGMAKPAQGERKPVAYLATDLDGNGDVALTQNGAKKRAGEQCKHIYPLFR